jgi:methionyl aminopeptidase
MIFYKTEEEIEIIRENCLLVCKTLALAGDLLRPGITGTEIDKKAEELIRDHGAIPGFKGYKGFPATLCISINEQVVHGIPSMYEFKDTDIVSIDCGVLNQGYYGDAAYTFAFREVDAEVMKLLVVTKESLYKAINSALPGNRIGDIGYAVQSYTEKEHKFGVVRELVGHGLGKNLHEAPEVPNFGRRGNGIQLKEGMVIAIEPMINMGTRKVKVHSDGWTIQTADKKPSAHYEHTVVIRKGGADILSDHEIVEKAIKNNDFLSDISIKN